MRPISYNTFPTIDSLGDNLYILRTSSVSIKIWVWQHLNNIRKQYLYSSMLFNGLLILK